MATVSWYTTTKCFGCWWLKAIWAGPFILRATKIPPRLPHDFCSRNSLAKRPLAFLDCSYCIRMEVENNDAAPASNTLGLRLEHRRKTLVLGPFPLLLERALRLPLARKQQHLSAQMHQQISPLHFAALLPSNHRLVVLSPHQFCLALPHHLLLVISIPSCRLLLMLWV